MYSLIRPLLFKLDPEKAHHLALSALNWAPQCCFKKVSEKPVTVMGLTFPHRIGLAAGLDKNAQYLDGLSKCGFSFIEVGTVTPRPQSGNPKPRLFRLEKAHAIINRMGFNNLGVDVLIENIQKARYQGILGINIGKNKDTPLANAGDDYLHCLRKVYEYASYVTINLSSPNTPDLRLLQRGEIFEDLLDSLCGEQIRLTDKHQRVVPLVVKVSPDESDEALKTMADVALKKGISGMIATNTTSSRVGVEQCSFANEEGGLSGRPLRHRSTECLRLLKAVVGDGLALIGVGGIEDAQSAREKFEAGASLVQLYTGLVYGGPDLISALDD